MYNVEQFVARNFDYKYYGNPPTDLSVCCPFCAERVGSDDDKYHLKIHMDPDKQVVHCFRCDYSTNWVGFVIAVMGVTYIEALSELYVTPRVRSDMEDYVRSKFAPKPLDVISKEFDLPDDFQLLSVTNLCDIPKSPLAARARMYLRKRGALKDAIKHNLGVAESVGFRVIIPIEKGYWQARRLFSWMEPKYLNPSEPATDILFNAAALEMYDEVVVCEGFFSAITVGDNAVALIGKEPTKEKIARLVSSNASSFIIALEAGAFLSMGKLADALRRAGKQVTIWKYEIGDPADNNNYTEISYDLKAKVSMLLKQYS